MRSQRGRVCGRHLPRQTPPGRHPQADTPRQTPPGRHPLGRHPLPSARWDTQPPAPMHAGIHTPRPAQCMLGYTPPPPTWAATAADGTHPTGMHSCHIKVFMFNIFFNLTSLDPLQHPINFQVVLLCRSSS